MAKKSALVKSGTLKDLVSVHMLVVYAVFFIALYFLVNTIAATDLAGYLPFGLGNRIPGIRFSTALSPTKQAPPTESGSVTLSSVKGQQTKVVISATNEPAGASQPAAIVSGKCSSLGGTLYTLNSVVNGSSVTTLSVKLSDLEKKVPLSVVVSQAFCTGILQ